MMANSKDIIEAQKCAIKKRDLDKQNDFNKANTLVHKKKDNAVHSYKLLKYENYKMRLVN